MNSGLKKTLIWFLAVLITLAAAVFQRMTGPTYPIDAEISNNNETYSFELPRSHGGESDCPVNIELPTGYSGKIIYRRFPTSDPWSEIELLRTADTLFAMLPNQPPAGKLEYHLELFKDDMPVETSLKENVVVRFKGDVPAWALIPHIILMFFAMLWSNSTGLMAAVNIKAFKKHAIVAAALFILGGLIFGPIVQKYAFGAYWTGWPFGEDLTDNKVLASVILWVAAILLNRKKERRWMVILASLFLFAIYMIPHSARGSELDYESGEVMTGSVIFLVSGAYHGFLRKKTIKKMR